MLFRSDPLLYNQLLQRPIYTGNPVAIQQNRDAVESPGEEQPSFQTLLEERIREESTVAFSKHAMERVVERNVDVSPGQLERLNEGVRLAEEKGLRSPLILMDTTAFVVNVPNNKVVTVVNDGSLKGTVFTNIDGTVMI